MMMLRSTSTLLATLLAGASLAGCSPRDEPQSPSSATPPAAQDLASCGADKLSQYVGALPSADALDDIRSKSGAETSRVVRPGDAMTMDYRVDRLTIEVGEDGRIKAFRCV